MAKENPLVIAHRGASGYAPENTLLSFAKALEYGANGVELDIHVCKSGELVVIHDPKIDRTTNGKGVVAELTLSEIQSYRCGEGEKVPTLAEVFDLIDRRCIINVELKGEKTAGPLAKLIQQYVDEKGWSYQDFFVSSLNLSH